MKSLEVNDIICLDVWLLIIEIDPEVFCLVRLINRDVRDYTNDHMDRYMNLFARKITESTFCVFGYLHSHYSVLPNGNKHGMYVETTAFSSVLCNYKNGELDGEYLKYNGNDSVKRSCNYRDGKLDGGYKEYRVDGPVKKSCNYEDGKLNGEYKEYHKNGFTKISSNYNHGLLHGLFKQYYMSGPLMISHHYRNGKLDPSVKLKPKICGDIEAAPANRKGVIGHVNRVNLLAKVVPKQKQGTMNKYRYEKSYTKHKNCIKHKMGHR